MSTRFRSVRRLLPVAILLSLCLLSVTAAMVQEDVPAWAEVMQHAG